MADWECMGKFACKTFLEIMLPFWKVNALCILY